MNRDLIPAQMRLIRSMLGHGNSEARDFLSQLEKAEVTPYQCPCGCASINLSTDGLTYPSGRLHVLADFIFGTDNDVNGVFVFEKQGLLAGLGVYGLSGDAPKTLPSSDALRLFSA
jgi:hypothetical protein